MKNPIEYLNSLEAQNTINLYTKEYFNNGLLYLSVAGIIAMIIFELIYFRKPVWKYIRRRYGGLCFYCRHLFVDFLYRFAYKRNFNVMNAESYGTQRFIDQTVIKKHIDVDVNETK